MQKNTTNGDIESCFQTSCKFKSIVRHLLIRGLWALFLKFVFTFFIRIKIQGNFKELYKKYPKLIIISNHTSHLDGPAIFSSIPFAYWYNLYILAAKDYWFTNSFLCMFSKYFMGAISVDRKKNTQDSIKKCINILNNNKKIWLVMFPEGSRTQVDTVQIFKSGLSIFSQKTNTPILFLYLQNSNKLWPKHFFPKPGKMSLHIGDVQKPDKKEVIFRNYQKWISEIENK